MAEPQKTTTTEVMTRLQGETEYPVQAVNFLPVEDFTTFRAEYTLEGDDLVFHFFRPSGGTDEYWEGSFPEALEEVAKSVFHADYPRLEAQFISDFDLDSWWFRARGFAQSLDPDALAYAFLENLDVALDAENET